MKKTFLLMGLLISTFSFAQSYSIDWYKIAGGGGTSTGATYASQRHHRPAGCRRRDERRQLLAHRRLLESHFRCANGRRAESDHHPFGNSVIVSWPNTGSYTLQQNANLALASGWTTSGYSISTSNGTNSITITPPTGNLFFRLKQ